ncbi:helix-turn-helix domain-containing protein [Enterococcus asini]|uniref:helix-turn-helix domain-containing protein n=1 Tax=Enterococcus asini TaxID=57732 RepID=UPI00241EAD51|nr:helix-turn-helix transcriptional regulator [Enterococcus asini]
MNRIAELRKSIGLTQKELAKKLEISPVTLSRYETGDRIPNFDILKKMSEIFNDVPVEFIMKDTDNDKIIEVLDKIQDMTDDLTESIYKTYINAFTKLNDSGKKELFKYSNYLASQEQYKANKTLNAYFGGKKIEVKDPDIKIIRDKDTK